MFEAGVTRPTRSGIRLTNDHDPVARFGGKRSKLVIDRIGRLVIDNDDMEIAVGLGKNRTERTPENARLLLVVRNDN